MSESSSRRDFLRTGTALLASGLAVPKGSIAIPEVPAGLEGQGLAVGGSLVGGGTTSSAFEGPAATQDLSRFAEDPSARPPKWQAWWQNNFLRADFDMLMTDASPEALSKIDPEDIIATIADAGIQGFWGYIQDPSGWLYYSSKIGRQFPNLKGRDLVAEFIAACRKYGLKFMAYYDPFESRLAVTEHPEWRLEFPGDRVPSSPRLWGNLCLNRPGCLDFLLSILRESASRYDMDAVLFDDFGIHHCGCADCQKRYRAETGRDLPFYETPQRVDYPDKLNFGRAYPEASEFGHYYHCYIGQRAGGSKPRCAAMRRPPSKLSPWNS